MLKLELQYFGHLMQKADSFEKTLMLGNIEGRRRSKKLTHLKRLWCWERLRAGGEGDWGQKEKVIDFLPKSKHLLISWLQSPSTVILDYKEKDYKEIKLIHPKDHSWVFIGRTDVEAGTPVLWTPDAKSWLIWKDPDAGKDWGQEEKGMTEDEMVGWHHRLDGHGFVWTPRVGDWQGSLACCGSWCHRVGHNWATELNWINIRDGVSFYWKYSS